MLMWGRPPREPALSEAEGSSQAQRGFWLAANTAGARMPLQSALSRERFLIEPRE
jgi:hypothetical protein